MAALHEARRPAAATAAAATGPVGSLRSAASRAAAAAAAHQSSTDEQQLVRKVAGEPVVLLYCLAGVVLHCTAVGGCPLPLCFLPSLQVATTLDLAKTLLRLLEFMAAHIPAAFLSASCTLNLTR